MFFCQKTVPPSIAIYGRALNCTRKIRFKCFSFVSFQFGSNQANSKNDKTNPYNPRLPQNQFPILVFYPRDKKGVQYHGPLTVEAILEFLLSARNPIFHLRSKNDLLELQARHNGKVIVGNFPEIDSKYQLQGRKAFRYKPKFRGLKLKSTRGPHFD